MFCDNMRDNSYIVYLYLYMYRPYLTYIRMTCRYTMTQPENSINFYGLEVFRYQ